jgi:hypothetical protein
MSAIVAGGDGSFDMIRFFIDHGDLENLNEREREELYTRFEGDCPGVLRLLLEVVEPVDKPWALEKMLWDRTRLMVRVFLEFHPEAITWGIRDNRELCRRLREFGCM